MRKLIVLMMTSVLATGAVAQADTVNVTEDPKDFINILSITDSNGDDVTTLTPSMDGARTYYNLRAEVFQPLNGNAIDYFSVCLYDPASLDQSTTLDDLCGYGPGDTDPDAASAKGTNNPKSALQVSRESTNWVHDFEDENANDLSASGREWILGNSFSEPAATFRGTSLTGNEQVFKASAPVALSHAAANATGWKVRAVVYFADGTRHELIDDLNTYSVAKFKALDTERTTVDYENVIPGESSVKRNITTGSYYANHSVDVTIEATKFASGARPATEVEFTLADPDTANAFGLNCKESGSDNNWLSAIPNDLMTGEVASNTQTEVEDPKTLPTHDCVLMAGDGVAVGSYSNVVTVGIDAAS